MESPLRRLNPGRRSALTESLTLICKAERERIVLCWARYLNANAKSGWLVRSGEQGIDFDSLSVRDSGFIAQRNDKMKAAVVERFEWQ